jgi:hypothetical protein
MTAKSARLTDELLRRSLTELAAGPDADELLTDVIRTVDSTTQVHRRPWDLQGFGRPALLLAAVLLLTASIGLAVFLSSPRPEPQPSPTASARPVTVLPIVQPTDFIEPFRYTLPPGESITLRPISRTAPHVVYGRTGATRERTLEVFLVTGIVHTGPCNGVDPDGNGGPTRGFDVDQEPRTLLEDLRDEVRVAVGPISQARLGNIPAFAAEIDPTQSICANTSFHENGQGLFSGSVEPTLENPSKLIVGRIGDRTIAVLISATTEEALAEWLPIAQAYVDSFRFDNATEP